MAANEGKRVLKRRNMKPKTESAARHVRDRDVIASEEVRIEVLEGPSYDQIQQRAYEIYVNRGGTHGQDLEDWLQAERELKAKHPSG